MTGVQTCALPIYHDMIQANLRSLRPAEELEESHLLGDNDDDDKLDVL